MATNQSTREDNAPGCPHYSSVKFAVVQTYKTYYLCECSRCQQCFILPRRTKGEAA